MYEGGWLVPHRGKEGGMEAERPEYRGRRKRDSPRNEPQMKRPVTSAARGDVARRRKGSCERETDATAERF